MIKKSFNLLLPLWVALLWPLAGGAQPLLTLPQAIELALQNNYQQRLNQLDIQNAQTQATHGNAGLLPTITATGQATLQRSNVLLEFAGNQPSINRNGALSQTTNGTVNLDYVIFDGFGGYRRLDQLRTQVSITRAQNNVSQNTIVLQTTEAFYALAQAQHNINTTRQNLKLSQKRLNRAQTAQGLGSGNGLEVLNAEVNVNTDSAALLRLQLQMTQAKRNLNYIIGRDAATNFAIDTTLQATRNLPPDSLMQMAQANNPTLKLNQVQQQNATLGLEIAESARWPVLSVGAAYNYTQQQNDASFIIQNTNQGLTGNLQLRWFIFDGFRRQNQLARAKIGIDRAQLQTQQIKEQIRKDVLNGLAAYNNAQQLLALEQTAVATAQQNYNRAQLQFGYGNISGIVLREAQLNLLQARLRLTNARYTLKLEEARLLNLVQPVADR